MDPGPRPGHRQPREPFPQRRPARVPVHDDHGGHGPGNPPVPTSSRAQEGRRAPGSAGAPMLGFGAGAAGGPGRPGSGRGRRTGRGRVPARDGAACADGAVGPYTGRRRAVRVPRRGGTGRAAAVAAWSSTPPQQLLRTGRRLLAVVGQQQTAVLAVAGPDVREPAQPGPLRPCAPPPAAWVRADQHDLQQVGECSAASWASTARASPDSRGRGPARPTRARLR